MPTIEVVLDDQLLRGADQAAASAGVNRSALIREALATHLKAIRIRSIEDADRQGYEKFPVQDDPHLADLEDLIAWPEPKSAARSA